MTTATDQISLPDDLDPVVIAVFAEVFTLAEEVGYGTKVDDRLFIPFGCCGDDAREYICQLLDDAITERANAKVYGTSR